MTTPTRLRVAKEIWDIQRSSDLSLAASNHDDNVENARTLITGPPDTPYEFGFFEFDFKFCNGWPIEWEQHTEAETKHATEYPMKAPIVTCLTTNSGSTRFNPNIYADGKVCLSILGTWAGRKGEQWSTALGVESVLLSIQSLLSANPYENEPGFEKSARGEHVKEAARYALKIRHETLRVSVIEQLERTMHLGRYQTTVSEPVNVQENSRPPSREPFANLLKRRFLWYYDTYKHSIRVAQATHGDQVADGIPFALARFETLQNGMRGEFRYSSLLSRLDAIKAALDRETATWIAGGPKAVAQKLESASECQQIFERVSERVKREELPWELYLVDQNPFQWGLTLFGRSGSVLEGGIIKIRIIFRSNDYVEVRPRIVVDTPLFHEKISPSGVLCYEPERPADMFSHLECISKAIENEEPVFNPHTRVNAEAAKLLWGNDEDKKLYRRKLRRSAQESAEL